MKTSLIALALALVLVGCTHNPTVTETPTTVDSLDHRHPAATRLATLPDQSRWQSYYDFADNLDLHTADLRLHQGSGSSIYGVIYIGGKPYGALIPPNSSGHPSGEVFAWTLARSLGVPELYQLGISRALEGDQVAEFMKIVPRTRQALTVKEENRQALLRSFRTDPSHLEVAFKLWDQKPHDWPDSPPITLDHKTLSPQLVLDGSSASLSSLISCDGPKPSKKRTVSFAGGTTTEREAAREVSSILLIDALTQQFDRFTGGNLQTFTKDGHASFASVDNGGTWGGLSSTQTALASVTRFDHHVADEILEMDDFVSRGHSYRGLHTPEEFMAAFDIAHTPIVYSKYFVPALKLTADWIRQHKNCYF